MRTHTHTGITLNTNRRVDGYGLGLGSGLARVVLTRNPSNPVTTEAEGGSDDTVDDVTATFA